MNFNLVLDRMLFFNCQLEDKMPTNMTARLYTLRAGKRTSLKSSIVMTQDQSNN